MIQNCITYFSWVEEEIEEPIRERIRNRRRTCGQRRRWWQRLFCWFVWFWSWVVLIVIRVVVKAIPTIICLIVTTIITTIAATLAFFMSIPIIGPIIKTAVELVLSPIRRAISLVREALLFWVTKKTNIVVLVMDSEQGPADPAIVDARLETTKDIFKRECNIEVNVLDINYLGKETPKQLTSVESKDVWNDKGLVDHVLGDAHYAAAHLIMSEYIELNVNSLIGIKAPAFVIFTTVKNADGIMHNVWGNNFVFVDDTPGEATIAHELGHLFGHIWHVSPTGNLMTGSANNNASQSLNIFQRTLLRTSKYCSFL